MAIPVCQQRISPVLDTAARLLLVTWRRGKEVGRREFVISPLPPEALARSVAELRVDMLLCAAISEPLLRALERRRVQVLRHLCGDAEAVLHAFCCRRLTREEFRMPGCWGFHLPGACCRHQGRSHAGKCSGQQAAKQKSA